MGGKKAADTKGHKDDRKKNKQIAGHSELNNNMIEYEGLAREGEHVDGDIPTKIEHKRNMEKKLKKRELNNDNITGDEGLAREGEHMDGESQTKIEHERKKEKKMKKSEVKNNITEDEGVARGGEHMDGESQTKIVHEGKKEKKRKKRDKGLAREGEHMDGEHQTNIENGRNEEKKKKKRRKIGDNEDLNVDVQETPVESIIKEKNGVKQKDLLASDDTAKSAKKKVEQRNKDVEVDSLSNGKEYDKKAVKPKKNKKKKKERDNKKFTKSNASERTKDLSSSKTPKKVNFSEHVEVFPSLDDSEDGENQDGGLVRGKRFSPEEDEMVQQAVLDYIDQHGLGEEGLKMVLQCRSHPKVKDCWKHIAAGLPWRPVQSVYYRAHILFERDDKRTWTPEEMELVRNHHEKHGSDWRALGDAIGKHRLHVKDTWRRLKVKNRKRGSWSQDEYQTLFNLVNTDLRLKASEERMSKHGMLRDNISWEAISDKLSTRSNALCCQKWYLQLTSSMVAEGKWADADDYRLISALVSLDAACIEDVDWDNVLEHRSGDICLKRWKQMTRYLGNDGNMSFLEQVEVLADRYCPDMLEARETYDSKPLV